MNAKRTSPKSGSDNTPDSNESPDLGGDESKSPLRLALSANLLVARGEAQISQRDLAKKSGLNQPLIWEIERRARNVTLETVTALARALGKSEWDLLARKLLTTKSRPRE